MLPFDDNEVENRLQLVDKYFHDSPIVETGGLDYIGGEKYEGTTQYWFVHTISELLLALGQNQFTLIEFVESASDISAGHRKIEQLDAKIPLSMIMLLQNTN